ncbi:MAG: response regulator transcription factor [Roseococcus sp.]|nr:response regulator transcription factor [Roseococcus sp.]
MSGPLRIALVEDDPTQRHIVAEYLARHGLRPACFAGGAEFKRALLAAPFDLVLLDVNLGEAEDGFALARWARARSARLGIIMLTAAGETVDRVVGLESGADDYVTKPFEPRELLARVKALLRRSAAAAPPPPLQAQYRVGTARLDMERRVLILADGREDALSASEFDLLRLFVLHPNRPLTREWLLEAAAHREAGAFDRAIDNRVMRLRRKIERDPAKPEAIRSVRGVGYLFVPPAD